MLIDWTTDFDGYLDRLEAKANAGDEHARATMDYVLAELDVLQQLTEPPQHDTAVLMRVRQSRKHQVWRLSHPYDPRVAVRLICWFGSNTVVVALFAGEKARIGDAFYNSVGTRADALINQWKRQTSHD